MKFKKVILLTACTASALCLIGGIHSMRTFADEVATTPISMLGASIRYEQGEDGKSGMRFGATMSLADFQSYAATEGVEIGFLIAPSSLHTGALTYDLATGADDCVVKKYVTFDAETRYWGYETDANGEKINAEKVVSIAYLWGIPVANYNDEIMVRSYVKADEIKYSDIVRKSIDEVAYLALADETDETKKAQLEAYLNANTYKITFVDENNEKIAESSGKYGDKIGVGVSVPQAVEKAGYNNTYLKGGVNFDTNVDYVKGDTVLTVKYEAKTDTEYNVEVYGEQYDGTFEKIQTLPFTGTTDAEVILNEADMPPVPHEYLLDTQNENNVFSGVIAGDGSLVLKVYLKANPLVENFERRTTGGGYTGISYKDGIATSGFKAAKIVSDENAFMGANGNTYITSTYLEGSTKMLYLANGNQGLGWIRIQLTDAQCAMYYAGGTLSFKYRLIADAGNGSVYTFTIGEQTGYKVDGETVTSITGINSNEATWHTVTMNVKDIPTLDGDSLLLRTVWASGANYAKNYDIWIDDIVVERPADATQGAYAVRHYVQTEMGGLEYTLRKTEYKSGTVGEQTEATALEIAGYTAQAIEQKTIGNEFIYVDVYYTRLALIDFEDGKADNVTVTGCAKSVKLKSDTFNMKNLLPESPDCYLGNAANGTRSLRVANTEKGAAQIRIELTAEQKEAVKNGGKISFVVWGRSVSTVDLKISANGGEAKTLRTQLWATANQTIEIDVAAGTEYLTLDIAAAGTQWVLWLDDIVVK